MDIIKPATDAQIARIADKSDLGPSCAILAMGEDLAVIRQVTEIDPVVFDDKSTTARRLMFIWGLEQWLRLTQTWAYYFNVKPDDETWLHNVKTHGAEQVSAEPELRFRKILNPIVVKDSTNVSK